MHVARYTIYLWPLLFVSIPVYYSELPRIVATRPMSLRRPVFGAGFLLLLVLVMGAEVYMRRGTGRGQFYATVRSIENSESAAMLRKLGNPTKRPISLAYYEVQARAYLDDRFVVRSLDGIVDEAMTKYFCDGFVDHIGYLLEREVDYVTNFGSLNRDEDLWSLGHVGLLRDGKVLRREGLTFTKVGDYASVEIDREYYSTRPHVRCDRSPYVLRENDFKPAHRRLFF